MFIFTENFHHLHALLSQLKISVLESYRKDAKQKYGEALKAYVTQYFGRPLEKLNVCITCIPCLNQGRVRVTKECLYLKHSIGIVIYMSYLNFLYECMLYFINFQESEKYAYRKKHSKTQH